MSFDVTAARQVSKRNFEFVNVGVQYHREPGSQSGDNALTPERFEVRRAVHNGRLQPSLESETAVEGTAC